ncbi:MAG: DUF3047 domain-containing protein [Planctomycetes bacterium]|nr:DUF3047 domain-containing protein [Planctomycetota bacterium]
MSAPRLRARAALAALAALPLVLAQGWAQGQTGAPGWVDFGPPGDPSPGGWTHVELPSVGRATDWAVVHSGAEAFVRARARAAASCLLHPVDVAGSSRLRWRWRAHQVPRRGDGSSRATDDFAARVGVGFEGDWSDAGWLERRRAEALRARLGRLPPRRWIHYVWSGGARVRGERFASPYRPDDVGCVVLRAASDPARRWLDEEVDPAADHAALFGRRATRITALMLMTDADDTGELAEALYGPLELLPARGP